MDASRSESSLTEDDLLSLSIGRLVRAHARVEYGLRNVHDVLADAGGLRTGTSGFLGADRLSNDCVLRLKRGDISPELVQAGEQALRAAQEANSTRNSIVHDLWLMDGERSENGHPQWHAFGATRGAAGTVARSAPGNIQTVDDARAALERASVRISGLFMALHAVLPRYAAPHAYPESGTALSTYYALMNDQFRLESNGDWTVTAAQGD